MTPFFKESLVFFRFSAFQMHDPDLNLVNIRLLIELKESLQG